MKKLVVMILVLTMLIPTVLADNKTSSQLERVLSAVKSKVDIEEELSEFESNVTNYDGKIVYNFDWHDAEYEKSMSVSADKNGHVLSYYNYSNKASQKKISDKSKEEIIAFADAFLEKTLPEMHSDDSDKLVFDEKSYSADTNQRYAITYNRYKNSIPVKDNCVNITVCISEDNVLYVRSLYANIDYDTSFEKISQETFDYSRKYTESFPIELVYQNEYNSDWKVKNESRMIPVLVFRIKDNHAGYISIENGEIVEEDLGENGIFREESSADSSIGAMNKNEALTEKEIAEITAIDGLLSVEEIEAKIKKLPHVKFPENLKLTNSSLSKDETGNYIYNLSYSADKDDDYNYFYMTVNAENAKLSNMVYNEDKVFTEEKLTEAHHEKARKDWEEFLKATAEAEFDDVALRQNSASGKMAHASYSRYINGVKHITDGIDVSYDAEEGCVTRYSLNFTKGEFVNPQEAISPDIAYENLLDYSPVIKMYVKSKGKYVECATLETHGVTLDALTGEIKNVYSSENQNFSYNDIDGHWAEEAATKLAEIQIGLNGEALNPGAMITQEEFLRFAASGIYGKHYRTYTSEELYDSLIHEKIILQEEKNPTEPITREQAFVYVIRMINLEKVAKLENIYKVDYADGNMLSEGKIGYCAILSGMGVICGDGGYLRPADNLTRAEAVVMLYRYLLTA